MRSSSESWVFTVVCGVALVVSCVSLSLNVYQLRMYRAQPVSAGALVGPGFDAARPDPANLLPILTGITRRLDALESAPATATPAAAAGGRAAKAGPPPAEDEPLLVRFEVPRRGVRVTQTQGGGIAVQNRDPSLTGQMMMVTAQAEDGSSRQMAIVVPPPTP